MKTNIGLPEKSLKGVTALLNVVLSDIMVLLVKTKKYHWNVTAPNFSELHAFFESQYSALAESLDQVAERIRSLGQPSIGSMKEFLSQATLKEDQDAEKNAGAMLDDLLECHEAIIRNLRKAVRDAGDKYKDDGTADFLTTLMEQHEKMAWMTRAYLS